MSYYSEWGDSKGAPSVMRSNLLRNISPASFSTLTPKTAARRRIVCGRGIRSPESHLETRVWSTPRRRAISS